MIRAFAACAALVLFGPTVVGQDQAKYDVRAHYTKSEYRIPMRDGVTLFTVVYAPKDTSKAYPFLMMRTLYGVGPYAPDDYMDELQPSNDFAKAGYLFVYQDVRGRFQSDGTWIEMTPAIDHPGPGQVDESTDTYDSVDWLLHHIPNNNGRVGLFGLSFPGFYAAAGMLNTHPAIKAVSPQAPVTALNKGDDVLHNGAFMLDANFSFAIGYRRTPPRSYPKEWTPFPWGEASSYAFFLKNGSLRATDQKYFHDEAPDYTESYLHTTDDAFWEARDLANHLHGVTCAVLLVGGLYDGEDIAGPMREFHALARQSPGATTFLVEGPWVHTGWAWGDGSQIGNVHFGSKTAEYFRNEVQLPFFEHYLRDKPDPKLPKALVFETGTNVWRRFNRWPPAGLKEETLYLAPGGKLGFGRPPADGRGYDEYVSDPAHPVPSVGYDYLGEVPAEHMVADQRFASERPDVLTYETEPLDADVTIAGPVKPRLFVSTSGTDSDFDVKLIDVYPDDTPQPDDPAADTIRDVGPPVVQMAGYQQLVRGEPMRGKFRKSFVTPVPFVPGKVEAVAFSMPDVNHTFLKGHRIMVQIQSSWFPFTDLNPQTFTDIPTAKPPDFRKATERIYHSPEEASGIVVGVLPSR